MKKKKFNNLKFFLKTLNAGRRFFIAAVLATVLSVLMSALFPQAVKAVMDFIINNETEINDPLSQLSLNAVNLLGGRDFIRDSLWIVAAVLVVIGLFQALGSLFSRYCSLQCGEKVARQMKNGLFSHIQRLPYSWHASVQTGDIIQRATSDADLIKRFISSNFIEIARMVFTIVISLTIMLVMDWSLALIAVGFAPVIIIYSALFFKRIATNFKAADEAEGAVTARLQENLTGIRVVRAFGRRDYESALFKEKNDYYVTFWTRLGNTFGTFWSSGDLITGIQILAVLIVGAVMTANQTISVGMLLAFLAYNQMVIWPCRNLGRMLGEAGKTKISLSRIVEIMDAEEEEGGGITPEIRGDVEFADVRFSYDKEEAVTGAEAAGVVSSDDGRRDEDITPYNGDRLSNDISGEVGGDKRGEVKSNNGGGEKMLLDGVSFKISRGSVTGILGSTGSGKSTAAYLLTRLYETKSGRILLDGIDITTIDKAHLRRNVALVTQDAFLFSKTVAENVAISMPSVDMGEVKRYTKIADLDASSEDFKDGYETMIGERGVTLSGGQRQRVAIARTLISRPPVIIFDDSLSAVDTETELEIRKALKAELKDATVILISHRITTLMNADKIIVLNDGRVEAEGTHGELLEKEGLYKRIYEIQSGAI